MAKRRKVGNLLALSLLSLLAQQPMYPYEMAQTLRARGKDKNFKINWGSLYTVVNNLEKYGLIEEVGTVREGRQPERTTYQITAQGLAELRDWLSELLSVPEDENSAFVTALSEGGILPPDQVIKLLTIRLATLDKDNAAHQADLKLWSRTAAPHPAARDRIPARHAASPGEVGARHSQGAGRGHDRRHRDLAADPRDRGDTAGVQGTRRDVEEGVARGARRRQVNDPGNGCGNTRNRGRNLTTSPAAEPRSPADKAHL